VTFAVSGLPPRGLSDVRLTGVEVTHTWAGDVVATLIGPGGSPSVVVFGRTGAASADEVGDSSNLAGPYTFADDATLGWWGAAATVGDTAAIPAGAYRASTIGGPGSTGATTNLTAGFASLTNPNGTWTLQFTDGCHLDTGSVAAATLGLTSAPPDCTGQQAAVTSAQGGVTSAEAAVAASAASAAVADQTVAPAERVVASTSADVTKRRAAVTKAKKAVKKAVKKAKKAGTKPKVKKAKKKLKRVKKKLASASAALSSATEALATAQHLAAIAHQAVADAQAARATANAQLTAAQGALTACEGS
jgi:subtilisin-like proprotein convertase family protein